MFSKQQTKKNGSSGSSGKGRSEGAASLLSSTAPTPTKTPSHLAEDLTIEGNITTTGDMRVDGSIRGDIRANLLTVGEKAVIRGEVVADDAVIGGNIKGCVRGLKVRLTSTAKVEGDIIHSLFAVESGAQFEGSVIRKENPIGDTPKGAGSKPAASTGGSGNGGVAEGTRRMTEG